MIGAETSAALREGGAVSKSSKRILLRGELDYTLGVCLLVCAHIGDSCAELVSGTREIAETVNELIRCEALGIAHEFHGVFCYSPDELRAVSGNPKKYLGHDYIVPDADTDAAVLELNFMRVQIRRCECAAVAFFEQSGDSWAESIATTLNRLSSAAYILEIRAASITD